MSADPQKNILKKKLSKLFTNKAFIYALHAQKCRNSLYDMVCDFWNVIDSNKFEPNWHIELFCLELEYIANNVANNIPCEYDLVINVPPGTTKSLIFTVFFPAWCWTKWPWMKFLRTSHEESLSLEYSQKCRDLIRSQKYNTYFPNIGIKKDQDTKSYFKITTKNNNNNNYNHSIENAGGGLFSAGISSSIIGRHFHIQLTDDPLDPKSVVSEANLLTAINFLDKVLPTRKTDKLVSVHILIMQRLAINDPSEHLLSKRKQGQKIKHINLPGEIHTATMRESVRPQSWLKYYDMNGGYLDPVRLGPEALQKLKIGLGGINEYWAQVLQSPRSDASNIFRTELFNIFDEEYLKMTFNPYVDIVRTVRYWDKAGTPGGGAYTVGLRMRLLTYERYYIDDVIRMQLGWSEREQLIIDTARSDGSDVLQMVEQEPGSGGKQSAEITQANLQKIGRPCKIDRPTGEKIYRARPFANDLNEGKIWIKEAPWNKDYIEEFIHMKYKDQIDATSGAHTELHNKEARAW